MKECHKNLKTLVVGELDSNAYDIIIEAHKLSIFYHRRGVILISTLIPAILLNEKCSCGYINKFKDAGVEKYDVREAIRDIFEKFEGKYQLDTTQLEKSDYYPAQFSFSKKKATCKRQGAYVFSNQLDRLLSRLNNGSGQLITIESFTEFFENEELNEADELYVYQSLYQMYKEEFDNLIKIKEQQAI